MATDKQVEAALDAWCDARASREEWRHTSATDHADMRAALEAAEAAGWQDIATAPTKPGTYISVRSPTTYRWLAYKKDGARQMGKPGRWQRATEYGWENAPLPEGADWRPLPAPPKDTPDAPR